MSEQRVEVTKDEDGARYVARVDGQEAGSAYYQSDGELVVFTHTEVDDAFEGRGVGSALIRGALDDVRAGGLMVVPRCPFVKRWIERHADYADLVEPI